MLFTVLYIAVETHRLYIPVSSIYFGYRIKLYFCFGRYAEDIAKVQKQYPSEPFKFLEPRFAVKLCTSSMTFWGKSLSILNIFYCFPICFTNIGNYLFYKLLLVGGWGSGEKRNQMVVD